MWPMGPTGRNGHGQPFANALQAAAQVGYFFPGKERKSLHGDGAPAQIRLQRTLATKDADPMPLVIQLFSQMPDGGLYASISDRHGDVDKDKTGHQFP